MPAPIQPVTPAIPKLSTRDTAPAAASSARAAAESAAGGEPKRVDFTRMTRRELADWVNEQIRAGTMSLEESSPFVVLTLKIPVEGGRAGAPHALDDQERVNFLDAAEKSVAFYRQRGDEAAVLRWEHAHEILESAQGRLAGLDARV